MTELFIEQLFKDPHKFFTIVFLVVFSVCCHEFMHAFVALKMGDDTATRCGHLTLNPLKQMGWFSLFMLLFIGIAWGQVPVNRANVRSRWKRVVISLAGPFTNLVLWLVCIGLCLLTSMTGGNPFAANMLAVGAVLNFMLFVFNLLPVPGLDGFNVLIEVFPKVFHRDSEVVKGAYLLLVLMLITRYDLLWDLARAVTEETLLAFGGGAA